MYFKKAFWSKNKHANNRHICQAPFLFFLALSFLLITYKFVINSIPETSIDLVINWQQPTQQLLLLLAQAYQTRFGVLNKTDSKTPSHESLPCQK